MIRACLARIRRLKDKIRRLNERLYDERIILDSLKRAGI